MTYGTLGLAATVAACHPHQTAPDWLVGALQIGVVVLAPVVAVMTVQAIARAVADRQASRGPIFPL